MISLGVHDFNIGLNDRLMGSWKLPPEQEKQERLYVFVFFLSYINLPTVTVLEKREDVNSLLTPMQYKFSLLY